MAKSPEKNTTLLDSLLGVVGMIAIVASGAVMVDAFTPPEHTILELL